MKITRESKPDLVEQHKLQRSPMLLTPRTILFLGIAGFSLTPWISSPLALALGMGVAIIIQNPFPRTSHRLARQLLQLCVVLLGFGMDLEVVLQAGQKGAAFAVVGIVATLLLGQWVGKWLQIPAKTSVLIAVGTAICGGSAIAAIASVIGAAEQEISIAIGTIFLLNAVALYIFPTLGHLLHLTPDQFGTWAGIGIHDISSVVGAASDFGATALEVATSVKLFRALWIVPVALFFAFWSKKGRTKDQYITQANTIRIPWFIGFFLLASIIRTLFPSVAVWSPAIKLFSKAGFRLTLFLIGTGLSIQALKNVGWQAIAQGIVLWIFASISSLGFILWMIR